ncbi:unnamed protein product [Amoebophrya sp. A25]|nr:unnamed protein product [Amoebophrya sp. A25]|eukprot:GSA25T00006575001.1
MRNAYFAWSRVFGLEEDAGYLKKDFLDPLNEINEALDEIRNTPPNQLRDTWTARVDALIHDKWVPINNAYRVLHHRAISDVFDVDLPAFRRQWMEIEKSHRTQGNGKASPVSRETTSRDQEGTKQGTSQKKPPGSKQKPPPTCAPSITVKMMRVEADRKKQIDFSKNFLKCTCLLEHAEVKGKQQQQAQGVTSRASTGGFECPRIAQARPAESPTKGVIEQRLNPCGSCEMKYYAERLVRGIGEEGVAPQQGEGFVCPRWYSLEGTRATM